MIFSVTDGDLVLDLIHGLSLLWLPPVDIGNESTAVLFAAKGEVLISFIHGLLLWLSVDVCGDSEVLILVTVGLRSGGFPPAVVAAGSAGGNDFVNATFVPAETVLFTLSQGLSFTWPKPVAEVGSAGDDIDSSAVALLIGGETVLALSRCSTFLWLPSIDGAGGGIEFTEVVALFTGGTTILLVFIHGLFL